MCPFYLSETPLGLLTPVSCRDDGWVVWSTCVLAHILWEASAVRQNKVPKDFIRGQASWSWWWTRKPGVLQSMELQRVGHDWATELNCVRGNGGGQESMQTVMHRDFQWRRVEEKTQAPSLPFNLRKSCQGTSTKVTHQRGTVSLGKGLQCTSHDGQKGAAPRALGHLPTPQS